MGRGRKRIGVLWGESGREKVSYAESQEEKMHPMGSANEAQFRVQVRDGSEQKIMNRQDHILGQQENVEQHQ